MRVLDKYLGSAHMTERCEMRSTANTCLSMLGWESSSGLSSRQMNMLGTPAVVTASSGCG